METKSNQWETTAKKNTLHLAYWTGCWVLTLALASFGQVYFWKENSLLIILFIAINTIVGVGMIMMNKKYLNGLDEMQRKVTLDAMAIALGVGVVGGLSYSILDQSNIFSFNAEIAHLVLLIAITYVIGIMIGYNRYK